MGQEERGTCGLSSRHHIIKKTEMLNRIGPESSRESRPKKSGAGALEHVSVIAFNHRVRLGNTGVTGIRGNAVLLRGRYDLEGVISLEYPTLSGSEEVPECVRV